MAAFAANKSRYGSPPRYQGAAAAGPEVTGSFWQLANVLTIKVLQICERRTRINVSPAKKTDLPFRITSKK